MPTSDARRAVGRLRRLLLATGLALAAGAAHAHSASDAYLQLDIAPQAMAVRWDVALRDLDTVLPLDANGDRALTAGELTAALPQVRAHLLERLRVGGCGDWHPRGEALESRADGTYLALTWHADCTPTEPLAIDYRFLAETDATHRGIAQLRWPDGRVEARVLDPNAPAAVSAPAASMFVEGVRHIVGGVDHLLFLLCLLLPALMQPLRTGWRAVAGVVTLFTLAHSATLALAVLGWVRMTASLVEPTIAATIVVAAVDNVRPIFGRWRAAVTFGFGLVHGLGFAGVLAELPLPPAQLGWSLLQFNLGIEVGQLVLVALAVPLLRAVAGGRPPRERAMLVAGSVLAGVMAAVWFVQRL